MLSHSRAIAASCMLLFFLRDSAGAAEGYVLTPVASTGAFDSIGPHVSMNDLGQVAFVGTQPAGDAVFVADVGGMPRNIIGSQNPDVRYGVSTWINDKGVVAARVQHLGSTTGTFAQRIYDGNDVDDGDTIATGGVGELFPIPIHLDDFDAILSFASLNNNVAPGILRFSNIDNNLVYAGIVTGQTGVAVDTPPVDDDTGDQTFAQATPVRPAVADDGRAVFKAGPNVDSSLVLWNNGLASANANIATNSMGFSAIGRSAGISDNGRIVTFYGNLSTPAACAQCDQTKVQAGPGIFASVQVDNQRKIVQIAGAAEGFTGFEESSRVGVNSTLSGPLDQRGVTVAYVGTRGGKQGVYTSRLNFFGTTGVAYDPTKPAQFTVTPPKTVVEQGEMLAGVTGEAQTFTLFDPVNSRDRGDLAFHVATTTGANAVVRARPKEVIFLDFDPVANFSVTPFSSTFFGTGISTKFVGNLSSVFSTLAPARTDLNNSVSTIQNNVVQKVQDAFDDANVNVKVLGRTGDPVPVDGPFMRVFVGDGPHGDLHPSGTAGVTWTDLFNQDAHDLDDTQVFKNYQETPLIFADNIFRLSNNSFTDENGASSVQISLADTGSHMITVDQVENAIASTIAHEVGHSLGLVHLDKDLNEFIMNATVSSPRIDGSLKDELRYPQSFGLSDQEISPDQTTEPNDKQNDQSRLAFAVGSNLDSNDLMRSGPSMGVQTKKNRLAYRASASVPSGIFVNQAVLGIVPAGSDHLVPELVDLGSGDLNSLLNVEISARPDDQLFLVASTDGNGIDIFSVLTGFSGQLSEIDLTNGLLVITDQSIRGDLANDAGQPIGHSLDIYRQVAGSFSIVGSLGATTIPEPAAIAILISGIVAVVSRRKNRAAQSFSVER
jgi:hypothetical protein